MQDPNTTTAKSEADAVTTSFPVALLMTALHARPSWAPWRIIEPSLSTTFMILLVRNFPSGASPSANRLSRSILMNRGKLMLSAVPRSQLPSTPHSTNVTGAQINFFDFEMSPAEVWNESDSNAPNTNEKMDTFIVRSFN